MTMESFVSHSIPGGVAQAECNEGRAWNQPEPFASHIRPLIAFDVPVEQPGVLATLSRWRSWVQIPSGTLTGIGQVVEPEDTRRLERRAPEAWEFDSPLGHCGVDWSLVLGVWRMAHDPAKVEDQVRLLTGTPSHPQTSSDDEVKSRAALAVFSEQAS
jgi:hypothetical protein